MYFSCMETNQIIADLSVVIRTSGLRFVKIHILLKQPIFLTPFSWPLNKWTEPRNTVVYSVILVVDMELEICSNHNQF